jgi:hypothetical protein
MGEDTESSALLQFPVNGLILDHTITICLYACLPYSNKRYLRTEIILLLIPSN